MTKIEIKNLTFGYDLQNTLLFDHVDLTIANSWKLGLIGRNGRGKTTLLKLLQGQYEYRGKVIKQVNFVYFPQSIKNRDLTVIEILNNQMQFEEWQIRKELELLDINEGILNLPFGKLSGGEQTKVLLALLFVDKNNFPLIDEPTNHLDIKSRKVVANYLKTKKQGFILVSHDRTFVNQVVDHILAIERKKVALYHGDYQLYEIQKKLADNLQQEQNEKTRKEITRLKQTYREKENWAKSRETAGKGKNKKKAKMTSRPDDTVARNQMRRAKAIETRMDKKIEEKETLIKNIDYVDQLNINFVKTRHNPLVKVRNLSLSFENHRLFEPISFEIKEGRQVAIIGENGTGKTSLIKSIFGGFEGNQTGKIEVANNISVSFVRQVFDEQGTLADFANRNGINYQDLLNILRKLGTDREVFLNRIEDMSLGQKKRVEFARSLLVSAELYVWDEPLNYLDIYNRKQIEQLITKYRPTMLIIEHDSQFLSNIGAEVMELR
ncbi:ribosomal protection-like ABC-F family protein [Liquorilactobacillus mali]|nr:ABC-F type ribosomal protection protein [Liquorilactobacillus mali]EJE97556.1 ABC transporter family protein [Liquorilactobacillus mali KCTC 3596 = DSM 20444]MDC7952977.1 ABC-F type ribosomal protection protein [Liquorilactobacillus mali]QFQ73981.1 ABC-F type ribosomal protection protein [Liquorilactobacillus mali]